MTHSDSVRSYVVRIGGRLLDIEAESQAAAARKATASGCSVWQLRHGIEVTVYEAREVERWRFQYEHSDPETHWLDMGEIVGIRQFVETEHKGKSK